MDLVSSPTALRRWALASLLANMTLVVTGGLVRVTGSGLGCSTWPQCEPGSYTPHPEAGAHAAIEFGNRLLTFVLVAVAVGTLIAAWKARDAAGQPRRRVRGLAMAAALGIPVQAVIGGISVLMALNPWVVGLHMVASIALIVVCMVLVHEVRQTAPAAVSPAGRNLVRAVFAFGIVAMLLGTVVTGAGPNSGDGGAGRNGLDLVSIARVHSLSVWVTVGLTVLLFWMLREDARARQAVGIVLVVEIGQGLVGYAQYALHLPAALVALHMLGTALFTAALANLWWLTRTGDDQAKISGSMAAATNTTAR